MSLYLLLECVITSLLKWVRNKPSLFSFSLVIDEQSLSQFSTSTCWNEKWNTRIRVRVFRARRVILHARSHFARLSLNWLHTNCPNCPNSLSCSSGHKSNVYEATQTSFLVCDYWWDSSEIKTFIQRDCFASTMNHHTENHVVTIDTHSVCLHFAPPIWRRSDGYWGFDHVSENDLQWNLDLTKDFVISSSLYRGSVPYILL